MLRGGSRRVRLCTALSQETPCITSRCFSHSCLTSSQETSPPAASKSIAGEEIKSPRKRRSIGETIFSGIQPTGVPHLGNYLGALRQWKQYQDETKYMDGRRNRKLLFSIVDLHALTHYQDPAELFKNKRETFASLLAIGLKQPDSSVFYQSSVRAHAQMMWYLSNVASAGYLSRMTQWKSKLGVSDDASIEDQTAREKLRLGLFSYPVLQAADILLYNTTLVPVGEDQAQHVEFARTLARSFNSLYKSANSGKDFFIIPKAVISPAKRIMSLKDPKVKMSKSHPDAKSRVLITDSAEDIHAKIKGALTDSIEGITYDIVKRPGVSNLIEILMHVGNSEVTCQEIASDNANLTMRAFKEHVAEEIVKCLAGIRDRFLQLMTPENDEIRTSLEKSDALTIANQKLARMETLMGLGNTLHYGRSHESSSNVGNKTRIQQEQKKEEAENEDEPDVLPQKVQGVDQPIAS